MNITKIESAVLLVAFVMATVLVIFPVQDPDTFWHLANGRAMVEEGRIVNEEIFSYTKAGAKFSNHEWLAQIILFLAYDKGGIYGLLALKLTVVWSIFFLLYKTARFSGADRVFSALLVLTAIYAGITRYTERPELFSLLFISLISYLLYGYRSGNLKWQALLFLPLIMLFWDFLHGAVYGTVFILAFAAGETANRFFVRHPAKTPRVDYRPLLAVFVAALLVMAISPYGPRSYGLFVESLHDKSLMAAYNMEYEPTRFGEYPAFWLLFALSSLFTAAFFLRGKIDFAHLFVLVPFSVAAIRYNRATAFFALVSLPALAYYQSGLMRKSFSKKFSLLLIGVLSVWIVVIKFFQPGNPVHFGYGIDEKRLPVAATRFVKESGLKGNMFNPGDFGGYLAYNLYPERRIFQYNTSVVFGDFTQITQSKQFLDRYKISYAIIRENPWTNLLFSDGRWVPVFRDISATVLVRNIPENAPLIEKYAFRYFPSYR